MFLPDASARYCTTVSDKGCFEVTGAGRQCQLHYCNTRLARTDDIFSNSEKNYSIRKLISTLHDTQFVGIIYKKNKQ